MKVVKVVNGRKTTVPYLTYFSEQCRNMSLSVDSRDFRGALPKGQKEIFLFMSLICRDVLCSEPGRKKYLMDLHFIFVVVVYLILFFHLGENPLHFHLN